MSKKKPVEKDRGMTFISREIEVRNEFDLVVGRIVDDDGSSFIFEPNGDQFMTEADLLEVYNKVAGLNVGFGNVG